MTTKPSASRRNGPYALLGILCAAALVGALAGPTRPLAATPFTTTGHWVYNSVLAAVFHVDGGTANVDAQLPLHAEEGSRVLQGDTHGYVVGPGRITPFDKATLTPLGSRTAPSGEAPLGIEAVGGPYAVYRNAGKVVRLGDPAAVVAAGGAIGSPVVTADGTMWLHRTGVGSICTLARDGVELSGCPVSAPADHAGALTVLAGRPAFVDLFTSRLHTVDGGAFGEGRPLGASLSPNARPAAADLAGRVAILDPDRSSLLLVDPDARPVVPVRVALPPGDYDGPVSTGEAVVLVDRQRGAVLTYGPDGALRDEKPVKRGDGEPRLAKGEDERVYVEDSEGTQVLVVARHGAVQDVDVAGKRDPAPRTEVPDPRPDQQVALPGQPPAGRPDPVPGRTAPAVPAPTTPAPAPTTALPGAPTPTTPAPRPPE
ncbi:fibronectin type III domain-containing protein, partial [Saccharothrix algeriensis]